MPHHSGKIFFSFKEKPFFSFSCRFRFWCQESPDVQAEPPPPPLPRCATERRMSSSVERWFTMRYRNLRCELLREIPNCHPSSDSETENSSNFTWLSRNVIRENYIEALWQIWYCTRDSPLYSGLSTLSSTERNRPMYNFTPLSPTQNHYEWLSKKRKKEKKWYDIIIKSVIGQ